LFDRRPFLRPDLRRGDDAARGRRQGWPSPRAGGRLGASRPRLDGGEHGVTLRRVGTKATGPARCRTGLTGSAWSGRKEQLGRCATQRR